MRSGLSLIPVRKRASSAVKRDGFPWRSSFGGLKRRLCHIKGSNERMRRVPVAVSEWWSADESCPLQSWIFIRPNWEHENGAHRSFHSSLTTNKSDLKKPTRTSIRDASVMSSEQTKTRFSQDKSGVWTWKCHHYDALWWLLEGSGGC